jgi:hypothetical protein
MSKQTNAAAVAGMIAGHKLYKSRANGAVSSASIPNPYHKPKNATEMVCKMAWSQGLKEGMMHASNGLTMKQLGAILLEIKS